VGFDISTEYHFVFMYYAGIPEWPKGADCKSAAERFGGSNPSPGTMNTLVERMASRFFVSVLEKRPHSSEAEHFFGKEEVMGPIPIVGL
jgi:hypothetical protein